MRISQALAIALFIVVHSVMAQSMVVTDKSLWDNWDLKQFMAVAWEEYSLDDGLSQDAELMSQLIDVMEAEMPEDYSIISDDGGGKVGNGGKVLRYQEQYYLLDYVWGQHAYAFSPRVIDGKNEFAIAASIISELIQKDPYRFKRYMIDLLRFKEEAMLLFNYQMRMINDSHEVGIPNGHQLMVVINQKVPQFIGEYRYRVNGDLWKQLDSHVRAGLLVHEIIYKEAIELGHVNADAVMYFNSYLNSKEIAADSAAQYQQKLLAAGFSYMLSGFKLRMGNVELDEDDNIVAGRIEQNSCVTLHENEYCFAKDSEVAFYPDGKLKAGMLSTKEVSAYRTPDEESILFLGASNYGETLIMFHQTTYPALLPVKSGEVRVGNKFVCVQEDSVVTIYPQGQIESFYLCDPISYRDENIDIKISNKHKITLYPDGALKSFLLASPARIDGKRYWREVVQLKHNN